MSGANSSVSRFRLVFEITGKGTGECELVRHLAPLTANALLKALPVQDRVHRLEDKLVYIETGLTIGAEKQRTLFKRGDLALMPSNASICFVIKDCSIQNLNPIGRIISNIEMIESCQPGDVLTVKRATV